MRHQDPRFSERDSSDQDVVRPDTLTGGFKMGAGTVGDLGAVAASRLSSSIRPITSVSRSAGQPFLTASATTDSVTRASPCRSGRI